MIVDELIEAMTEASGVTREVMLSKSRRRDACAARHLIWAQLRRHYMWSNARIGYAFGRDHATVTKGIQRAGIYLDTSGYDEERLISESFTRILTEKDID